PTSCPRTRASIEQSSPMAALFNSAGGERSVPALPTTDQQKTLSSGHLQVVPHREPELLQPAAAEPQTRHGASDALPAAALLVVQVAHRAARRSAEALVRRRRIVGASYWRQRNDFGRNLSGGK